jgi:hypothetical protein
MYIICWYCGQFWKQVICIMSLWNHVILTKGWPFTFYVYMLTKEREDVELDWLFHEIWFSNSMFDIPVDRPSLFPVRGMRDEPAAKADPFFANKHCNFFCVLVIGTEFSCKPRQVIFLMNSPQLSVRVLVLVLVLLTNSLMITTVNRGLSLMALSA